MISYSNGAYIPTDQLCLPVANDPIGTFRGYRIFTACRTIKDKVFHLNDHIDRLFNSAAALYMELPHNKEMLGKLIIETVKKNKETYDGDLLVEIIYSGGRAGKHPLEPAGPSDVYIAIFPLKLPPSEWYAKGIKLATFPYQRQWPEIKLLNYIGGVIAHQTVVQKYNAHEALFVSPDGKMRVLEGTTFSFFMVRDSAVVTHPLDGKILAGITRKVNLKLAKEEGIEVKEEYFSLDEIENAKEAFITSSTRNLVPVVRIDDKVVGKGHPGEITRLLSAAFQRYLESCETELTP